MSENQITIKELRAEAALLRNLKYGVIRDKLEPEQWADFMKKPFYLQREMIHIWVEKGDIYFL